MRINNQVSLVEREGFGSPFFIRAPRLLDGVRRFKTKGSQATTSFPFVWQNF